jgi:hypothetical protein
VPARSTECFSLLPSEDISDLGDGGWWLPWDSNPRFGLNRAEAWTAVTRTYAAVATGGCHHAVESTRVARSKGATEQVRLHRIPWEAFMTLSVNARTRAASRRMRGCRCPATPRRRWSRRPEWSRRRPAWEFPYGGLTNCHFLPEFITSGHALDPASHDLSLLLTHAIWAAPWGADTTSPGMLG